MKHRAALFATVFVGVSFATFVSHAGLPPEGPRAFPGSKQYQNPMGQDISQNGWQSWQAPAATVNPEGLIPSDDSSALTARSSVAVNPAGPVRTDAAQLDKLFNQCESGPETSKPIEKIESSNPRATLDEPAAPAAAPKAHETKRVILIAGLSVAVLAVRKFRRLLAGPAVQKPSFL